MRKLRRNRWIWIGFLLLGISAWGNLYPPFVMPAALVAATIASGYATWLAFRKDAIHRGKLLCLPGLIISLSFLGLVALTPILDSATRHEIEVDGIKRTYRVRAPSSYDHSQPTPVLLVFHGYNQTGYTIERLSRLDLVGERDGFLVVYPQGFQRAWRTGSQPGSVNDITFVRHMITDLNVNYVIDKERIFAVGFSNGGSLVLSLGCELQETITAVVAVGARLRNRHVARCQTTDVQPVSAMFVNGTADRFVSWEGTRGSTRRWADLLHCELVAVIDTLPDIADDGTRVWRERYDHCPGESA